VGAGDIAEEMLHQGGAFQIGLAQPWALGLAATDPRAEPAVRSRAGEFGARWRELLAAPADDDPVGEVFAPYRGWRRGDGPAPVGVTGRYGELDVAVHQVGGWYDIFCESALRHHTAMATGARSGRARAAQRLVIGPWSHSNGLSNTQPEHDFGGAANGGYGGVLGAALRWTRRALDDEQVEGGIACFVMGEDRWVELDSWPPPARDMLLHLGAGGLAHEPGTGTDVLLHEPSSPVPTRGGRVLGPFLPMAGPVDQRPVEHREDVLVYTGEVLAAPVRVMGPVRLEARVDSTAAVYDLAVKLCDVHPDGRVLNVVDGVRRVRATPGEVTRVVVEVGSTAHVFRAGHRVRLHLAGSNFPRFDVTPEAGRHRVQRQGAALHLPVVVA
jgi:putative CocE/NonD family hydrolase